MVIFVEEEKREQSFAGAGRRKLGGAEYARERERERESGGDHFAVTCWG